MAKTLAQIVADVRQHIGQPTESNSNYTDDQLTIWINDAYRQIVVKIRHLPITTRNYTVSAQAVTLNSATITVDIAKLLNPDSGDYEQLNIISLEQLIAMDPDFESTTAEIPRYLVRTGVFTASLYPQPKASVIAQTTPLRTYGLELPTELSADGDTPDLPGNLHDIISHWPAFRAFSALENQVKATEQITLFNSGLKAHKGISTEFSRNLKNWRWG